MLSYDSAIGICVLCREYSRIAKGNQSSQKILSRCFFTSCVFEFEIVLKEWLSSAARQFVQKGHTRFNETIEGNEACLC